MLALVVAVVVVALAMAFASASGERGDGGGGRIAADGCRDELGLRINTTNTSVNPDAKQPTAWIRAFLVGKPAPQDEQASSRGKQASSRGKQANSRGLQASTRGRHLESSVCFWKFSFQIRFRSGISNTE